MIFVVDGNSMMNVVFSAILFSADDPDIQRPFYQIEGKYIIKDNAEKYYKNAILSYLVNCICSFPCTEQVYFAVDSKSWRKAFYSMYSNMFETRPDYDVYKEGYKGQRKIDSENKEQLLELIKYMASNVIEPLQRKFSGFKYITLKGLEGDDIVSHIVNNTNEEVVFWSNDSDMVQILRKNVYMIGSNDKKTNSRKLFVCNENDSPKTGGKLNFGLLNENLNGGAKSSIASLVSRGAYFENIVNPCYEVFTKILCGDKASDNIPAAFSYKDEKDKIVNITKVKVSDKIYSYFINEKGYTDKMIMDRIDNIDSQFIEDTAIKICEFMKLSFSENREIIRKGISFNIHMIRLCDKCIPKVLTEYVDNIINENKGHFIDLDNFKKIIE